jgi:hypothetical protein
VRLAGSADSMLVLEMKKNEHLFDKELFEKGVVNYAYFLGAAVMLDTHNFLESLRNNKWT